MHILFAVSELPVTLSTELCLDIGNDSSQLIFSFVKFTCWTFIHECIGFLRSIRIFLCGYELPHIYPNSYPLNSGIDCTSFSKRARTLPMAYTREKNDPRSLIPGCTPSMSLRSWSVNFKPLLITQLCL